MSRNLTRRDLLRTSIVVGAACRLSAVDNSPAAGSKLGIISDEVTDNLGEALDFISSYSLHWTELRVIWGKNIMVAPQADLDRAKKLLAEHNVQVSDIASPMFKWNLPQMPAVTGEKRDTFKASSSRKRTLTRCLKIRSVWRASSARGRSGSSATGASMSRTRRIRMSGIGWPKPPSLPPKTISCWFWKTNIPATSVPATNWGAS